MAQSSFSNSHFRAGRIPFAAGDHKNNVPAVQRYKYGQAAVTYVPKDPNNLVNNIPYAGYYSGGRSIENPFEESPTGFISGSFPSNHMEMPKPPLQRNSTFTSRKAYGHWAHN